MARRAALIVGVTGIGGSNLAEVLVRDGWQVTGLARRLGNQIAGVDYVSADVLAPASLEAALAGRDISHLFFTTWSRQATEAENCAVNGAMLRNTLEVLGRTTTLEHATLVTGLKHYLGPFEAYGSAAYASEAVETPFRESMPRVPYPNFYYDQEDILFEQAARQGFTWSVHRPHTMIGWALGNAMNMGVTLAVYGSICRETGEPFTFPGSPQQLNGVTDITDARLLGRHLAWSATEPRAANQAFNTVNGDVFRWRQMWPLLAEDLGVEAAPYPGHPTPLTGRMSHADGVWEKLSARHELKPHTATELASWWHTDADLSREVETFADMSKSRMLGFNDFQPSLASFLDLFQQLRDARIIPRVA